MQVSKLAGDECDEKKKKKSLGGKSFLVPSETLAKTSLLTSTNGNAQELGRSFSGYVRSVGHQDREAGARAENECSLARVTSSCIQDRSARIQKVHIKG